MKALDFHHYRLVFGLSLSLAFASPNTFGQAKPVRSLTRVELLPKAGGAVIRVTANGPLNYKILGDHKPTSRLVVDFPDTGNRLKHFFPSSPHPLVNRILMYEYDDPSEDPPVGRIVFDLHAEAAFRVKPAPGDQLIVDLTTESDEAAPPILAAPALPLPDDDSDTNPVTIDDSKDEVFDANSSDTIASSSDSALTGVENVDSSIVPESARISPEGVDPSLFFTLSGEIEPYTVGAEDVLDIRVFELDQLNRTVRVAGDGNINLPLIGQIRAGGLTPEQVSQNIGDQLKDRYVQNPQVSIFVKEFNSQTVSVLGAVKSPSSYALVGPRRLLQVLAEAGSLSANSGNVLYLFRATPDGNSARLTVPLSDLLLHGDPRWNILVRPGDVVSVPPGNALSVSVLGAVGQPGVYKLPPGDEGTLLTAIAQAGGLSDRASKKGVQIKRKEGDGTESFIKVNLGRILSGKDPDVTLKIGDVIIVKESFF